MSEIAYYVEGDFACSIHKHWMGHLCGYIGIPKGHPWYELTYYDIDPEPDVHGGLSYSEPEGTHPHETGLGLWWIGFDCAHAWDLVPNLKLSPIGHETYKDEKYVRREITRLVQQAAEAYRVSTNPNGKVVMGN